MVGGSAGAVAPLASGPGAATSLATPGIASFAATLEQLTSISSSGTTLDASGGGLFVGDLAVGDGGGSVASPSADGAAAGLANEMAVVALLASTSASAPAAQTVAPVSPLLARAPLVRGVGGPAPVGGVVARGGAVTGGDIVGTALLYRGTPYVWGGTSPSGFDCSGFTQYVYARWGIAIPRTSEEQATIGTPVASLASAQPGDLLFFAGSDGTASSPGHVGIYVGNGEMIDSPYTGTTVQVQPLSSAGPIVAIRRVLGSAA
jgi:cell wall-associated NlpC family hydrolase